MVPQTGRPLQHGGFSVTGPCRMVLAEVAARGFVTAFGGSDQSISFPGRRDGPRSVRWADGIGPGSHIPSQIPHPFPANRQRLTP
jgi:hypothetical protein